MSSSHPTLNKTKNTQIPDIDRCIYRMYKDDDLQYMKQSKTQSFYCVVPTIYYDDNC